MRLHHLGMSLLPLALPGMVSAQSITAGRSDSTEIIVTGKRAADGQSIPMSDWHVAETPHVLVFSRGDNDRLVRIAHNLEKLHFLLSVLFNRVGEPDDTIKVSVTLIGDRADFNQLGLRNSRWQTGPYPKAFPDEIYYDPREDGPVVAVPYQNQKILLEQGAPLSNIDLRGLSGNSPTPPAADAAGGTITPAMAPAPSSLSLQDTGAKAIGEVSFPSTSESRLYAVFAQHYLLTYFPNAYPRWYLQGFGEIFATFHPDGDSALQYGRQPEGFREINEAFGRYPLRKIVDGSYLEDDWPPPEWTPYRAWALVHLLFFDEQWKEPLKRYLGAVASGVPSVQAGRELGDLEALERQLATYRGRKAPFEVLSYPPDQVPEPIVRRLTRSEAALVRGRLELGARVQLPSPPPPGTESKSADRIERERREMLEARAAWLARLRDHAGKYPAELEAQLLLAEAECRSGNADRCLAAANAALELAPGNAPAVGWKGVALVEQGIAAPPGQRDAKVREGRKFIVQANRTDPEAVQPLLAYYRSFAETGEAVPPVALVGLMKVVDSVPSAPAPRVMLGKSLAGQGEVEAARQVLRPVAIGPYDSPERIEAQRILKQIEG